MLKKYMYVVAIFIVVSIILGVSCSNFIVTSNNHKAAEMYIGALKYSIEIDESSTNTLTVPTGETIIDVKVNNLNPVDTYYKLLYLNNSKLEIKYFSETKDTDEVKTSYKSPNDSITSSNTNNLKLFIRNNSTTSQNVSFSLKGGYINNTLSDIKAPNGYSEITTIEIPSSNTYFCKTGDTLTQGLVYEKGKYLYGYKAKDIYGFQSRADHGWLIDYNVIGWSLSLNDRMSTEKIDDKICTYINNKPITYTALAFALSEANIIDLSSFNSKYVTDMSLMFQNSQATTLDLSSFDTSNVIDMGWMFNGSQATTLDLSNFNTSKVTDMSYMFYNSQATTLDLSSFDTSNVTNMVWMFYQSQATTLDLSNFNTSNVTNMVWMFNDSQATTLNLSSFDTSKVTNMSGMFSSSQATTLDLSSFNTSNVTDMSDMFFWSEATIIKGLENFDTSNVTDMNHMFGLSLATMIDVSNFDTSNVTNMSDMFYGTEVGTIDVSNFNTSNVTNVEKMFSGTQLIVLDLSNFDTSNVINMNEIFFESDKLKTIYVSNKFNTDNVTSSINMFYGCTSLVGGSGTVYDSTKVDKTYAHIDGGTSNPGYFTDIADKPSSFSTDDWTTIVSSVKAGNTKHYRVGDTKTIEMGSYGTHTLRVANTSTPSECSTSGFSQTACGFVLEFADIITEYTMNDTNTNVGGWPASSMRTFANNDIYNSLPSDLKNGIIDTIVVSSYGFEDSSNFTSTDKLYLLAPTEIYSGFDNAYDTAKELTRQLDYYKNEGVTTSSYSKAIKMYKSTATRWWLRSADFGYEIDFYGVDNDGDWNFGIAGIAYGVSPAFRIG